MICGESSEAHGALTFVLLPCCLNENQLEKAGLIAFIWSCTADDSLMALSGKQILKVEGLDKNSFLEVKLNSLSAGSFKCLGSECCVMLAENLELWILYPHLLPSWGKKNKAAFQLSAESTSDLGPEVPGMSLELAFKQWGKFLMQNSLSHLDGSLKSSRNTHNGYQNLKLSRLIGTDLFALLISFPYSKGKELQKGTGRVKVLIKKDSREKIGQRKSRESSWQAGNEKGGNQLRWKRVEMESSCMSWEPRWEWVRGQFLQ